MGLCRPVTGPLPLALSVPLPLPLPFLYLYLYLYLCLYLYLSFTFTFPFLLPLPFNITYPASLPLLYFITAMFVENINWNSAVCNFVNPPVTLLACFRPASSTSRSKTLPVFSTLPSSLPFFFGLFPLAAYFCHVFILTLFPFCPPVSFSWHL